MLFWKVLFWGSWAVILYNYAGYALLACLIEKFFPLRGIGGAGGDAEPDGSGADGAGAPPVTFIVAAYNEQDCISAKIGNSLSQDYPAGKIEYIFVTDGSTDETPDIIKAHPSLRLLHRSERLGKTAALNRAVASATHEVIIVSDANTQLNKEAVRRIAAHYADPRVGGVAGEKKVVPVLPGDPEMEAGIRENPQAAFEGEGLYWKYESALKRIDSRFYSVVGAAGELFSFRKSLYEAVPENVILDDFIISMRVAQKGFRVIYEPGAYAMETPSLTMGDERKRKVRIAAGGFQSIVLLRELLQWWKSPRLSFLYISHRVLRWAASPFCLVLGLAAGAALCLEGRNPLYQWLETLLLLLFGLGLLSPVLPDRGPLKALSRLARLPRYFLFMNGSVLAGFARFLRGKQPAAWEKAKRAGAGGSSRKILGSS